MAINKISSYLFQSVAPKAEKPETKEVKEQEEQLAEREAVTLSQGLSKRAELEARERRVSELKQQVASGTYQIDSKKVAESVALELFT